VIVNPTTTIAYNYVYAVVEWPCAKRKILFFFRTRIEIYHQVCLEIIQ